MPHRRLFLKYFGLTSCCVLLLVALIVIRKNLSQDQSLFGQAAFKPANIFIDTGNPVGPMTRPWQSLAQGGESKNYQFTPVINQLKAIEPKYIRLDHIYDYYDIVSKNDQGNLIFNWTSLDQIINEIREAGATPFLVLSYMPPVLSQGDIVSGPTDWGQWQALVKATVEHVSGRQALNLSNVYYEVWNEPDLFGNWKTYGNKNYFTLYGSSVRGAQSAVNTNPFFIGGPATTALYDNWVNKFFEYAQANQLRVDFYSWHSYSLDPGQYVSDVIRYYDLVRKYPQFLNVEPIITEWGHKSDNDPGYDSNLSAAHTVAVLSGLIPTIKKAFIFEIQDGKDPGGAEYWGRWGLLTHQDFNSHEKPRYQTIKLLNKLGENRLSLIGQGSFVKGLAAQTDTGAIQILLTNYDPQNTHTETVPINLLNLIPGSYRLTTEFLSRLPTSTLVSTSTPTLIHNLTLPPNSVVLLTLAKQ